MFDRNNAQRDGQNSRGQNNDDGNRGGGGNKQRSSDMEDMSLNSDGQ